MALIVGVSIAAVFLLLCAALLSCCLMRAAALRKGRLEALAQVQESLERGRAAENALAVVASVSSVLGGGRGSVDGNDGEGRLSPLGDAPASSLAALFKDGLQAPRTAAAAATAAGSTAVQRPTAPFSLAAAAASTASCCRRCSGLRPRTSPLRTLPASGVTSPASDADLSKAVTNKLLSSASLGGEVAALVEAAAASLPTAFPHSSESAVAAAAGDQDEEREANNEEVGPLMPHVLSAAAGVFSGAGSPGDEDGVGSSSSSTSATSRRRRNAEKVASFTPALLNRLARVVMLAAADVSMGGDDASSDDGSIPVGSAAKSSHKPTNASFLSAVSSRALLKLQTVERGGRSEFAPRTVDADRSRPLAIAIDAPVAEEGESVVEVVVATAVGGGGGAVKRSASPLFVANSRGVVTRDATSLSADRRSASLKAISEDSRQQQADKDVSAFLLAAPRETLVALISSTLRATTQVMADTVLDRITEADTATLVEARLLGVSLHDNGGFSNTSGSSSAEERPLPTFGPFPTAAGGPVRTRNGSAERDGAPAGGEMTTNPLRNGQEISGSSSAAATSSSNTEASGGAKSTASHVVSSSSLAAGKRQLGTRARATTATASLEPDAAAFAALIEQRIARLDRIATGVVKKKRWQPLGPDQSISGTGGDRVPEVLNSSSCFSAFSGSLSCDGSKLRCFDSLIESFSSMLSLQCCVRRAPAAKRSATRFGSARLSLYAGVDGGSCKGTNPLLETFLDAKLRGTTSAAQSRQLPRQSPSSSVFSPPSPSSTAAILDKMFPRERYGDEAASTNPLFKRATAAAVGVVGLANGDPSRVATKRLPVVVAQTAPAAFVGGSAVAAVAGFSMSTSAASRFKKKTPPSGDVQAARTVPSDGEGNNSTTTPCSSGRFTRKHHVAVEDAVGPPVPHSPGNNAAVSQS